MKKTAGTFLVALAIALVGCGGDDDAAQAQVDQARELYAARAQGEPGQIPGTFILTKPHLQACVKQMEEIHGKLQAVKKDYPNTPAARSPETQTLSAQVVGQLGKCRESLSRL